MYIRILFIIIFCFVCLYLLCSQCQLSIAGTDKSVSAAAAAIIKASKIHGQMPRPGNREPLYHTYVQAKH